MQTQWGFLLAECLHGDAEVSKPAEATIQRAEGSLCPTIWSSGRMAGYAKFHAATVTGSY